jgi:hypothetical protein
MKIGKKIKVDMFIDKNIFCLDDEIHIYLFDVGVGLENSVDDSVRNTWSDINKLWK